MKMKKGISLLALMLCLCLCLTALAEDLLPGAKGDAVKEMQSRLNELEYYFRTIDGDYGNLSKNAVMSFQKAHGLEETGEATADVLKLLYSDEAVPASVAYTAEMLGRRIVLDEMDGVLYAGNTFKGSAQVENLSDDAPAKTAFVWYSSDKDVLKVTTDGAITGVSAGKARVYCCAKDDERIFASKEIEVRVGAKTIALDQTKLSLLIGADEATAKGQLVCTIGPEDAYDQSVIWSSSDESIVTVDENGALQALAMGTATITAKPGDESLEKTAACEVTVSRAVDSVALDKHSEMLNMGKTLQLTAEAQPEEATNRSINWISSDPTIATVSKGLVSGKKGGLVTITAEAADGSGAKDTCEVQVISAVKTLALSHKTVQLVLGGQAAADELQLACTVTPDHAYYQAVTWSSSDEQVATVDENGLVKAVADGTVTITATTTDPSSTASASCTITVGQAVRRVMLDQPTATVAKGKTVALKASVLPENALNTGVTWSSSNENIATVSAKGVVTGKGVGKATITCAAADGGHASTRCEVTVIQSVTSIKAAKSRLIIFAGKEGSVKMTVSPSDASNKTLKWSTADASVATVDQNGTVTGVRKGSTSITAQATDGSGRKASFNVTVEPAVPITLESIGTGVYNFNLLGLTVKSHCKTKTIADFDFECKLYSYNGDVIKSGNYSLGADVTIAPGSTRTIRRTLSGVGYASRFTFTITGVSFTDGTYYSIPSYLRDTNSYWR